MNRLTVVVPCYNEASRLPVDQFLAFARLHSEIGFLFVDDGSGDATPEVLRDLCDRCHRQCRFHRLPTNQGKAEAVRQGMLMSFVDGCEYAAFIDADLATPLSELPRMLQTLDENTQTQLVLGSRIKLLGHSIDRHPARYWLGRLFALAASCVLGTRIHDTQCGLKMFRSTPLSQRLFAAKFSSRWLFDVEFLARFTVERGRHRARRELYEMPLDQWQEIPGSRIKSTDFVKAIGELLGIYWEYRGLADRGVITDTGANGLSIDPAIMTLREASSKNVIVNQHRRAA